MRYVIENESGVEITSVASLDAALARAAQEARGLDARVVDSETGERVTVPQFRRGYVGIKSLQALARTEGPPLKRFAEQALEGDESAKERCVDALETRFHVDWRTKFHASRGQPEQIKAVRK